MFGAERALTPLRGHRRVLRVRSSIRTRTRSARSVQAHEVRAQGARSCRCRRVVPSVAWAPTHRADRDCRGRDSADVRAGEGGALARVDYGALPPRFADELPGRRRTCGGPSIRRRV